jgi:DNA repair exonuclease SbcCD nuclease subunit
MKIALLTDTHAGARNDQLVFNNYFIKFYQEVFFPYLDKNGIDTIIHLGDVFDRRKYVNFYTLNSWRKNVFEVLNSRYKTFIITGNHDCYHKNNNDINSLSELLVPYENICIINRPITMEFDNTNITFIPWISQDNEEACKTKMEKTKAQIVMGHFDIIGFQMYEGLLNFDQGFKPEVFQKFDMVLSGHYHHKSSSDNIHYLGAPYEMVWSDYEDPKGFHVLDTSTREVQFVQNPLHIFEKIVYDDTNKTYEDLNVQYNLSRYKDCYVKVVIEQKNNQNLFDQFLESLYKENPADVSIIEAILDSDLSPDKIDETKDTLTLLIDYVDGLNIAEENKGPLIELLKNLYMESQNIDV